MNKFVSARLVGSSWELLTHFLTFAGGGSIPRSSQLSLHQSFFRRTREKRLSRPYRIHRWYLNILASYLRFHVALAQHTTKSELAATHFQRAFCGIRPLWPPSRIAFAFVIAAWCAFVAAKLGSEAAESVAFVVSTNRRQRIFYIMQKKAWETHKGPQHPILHPLDLVQI